MAFDRSWLVRPIVSAPAFGISIPSVWKESEVGFLRAAPAVKSHGGFTAGGELTEYLRVRAHVEEAQEPAGPYELPLGVVRRRLVRVYMSVPVAGDPDVLSWISDYGLPLVGDSIDWTARLGEHRRVTVRVVWDPQNMGDHLSVESELFE